MEAPSINQDHVEVVAALLNAGITNKAKLVEIAKIVELDLSKELVADAKVLVANHESRIFQGATDDVVGNTPVGAKEPKTILLDTEALKNIPQDVLDKGVNKLTFKGANSKGDLYVLTLPIIKEIIVKGDTHQVDLIEAQEAAATNPTAYSTQVVKLTNAQVLTLAELA